LECRHPLTVLSFARACMQEELAALAGRVKVRALSMFGAVHLGCHLTVTMPPLSW
jgi:hypothetical protein